MLRRADDVGVLQLAWSVYQLQIGHPERAEPFLRFHETAAEARLGDPEYVYPWNLETVVNESLATRKEVPNQFRQLHLHTGLFETAAALANAIRTLENAEDGLFLEKNNVLVEVHRSIQRQFEWQRGFGNLPRLYRSALLYGSEESAEFFRNTVGLNVSDFMLIGFALYVGAELAPVRRRDADLTEIGVSPKMRELALPRLSIAHARAREVASRLRSMKRPTAYRGSVLRDYPIITVHSGSGLAAPLPPLILQRITSGLYLDVVGGGEPIWRGVGRRFEEYCQRYLAQMMDDYEVEGDRVYGSKSRGFRTPDVLAAKNGEITFVAECKAKRMTFEARYSDHPLSDARAGYEEIAKGIFQVWRFWSHARRGIFTQAVSQDCLGMVVTLDPWLAMAKDLEEEVTMLATKMAEQSDPEISIEDRRHVAVTLIDDVEYTLQTGATSDFMKDLEEATRGDKIGWLLSTVRKDRATRDRPYPFKADLNALLPWWRAGMADADD